MQSAQLARRHGCHSFGGEAVSEVASLRDKVAALVCGMLNRVVGLDLDAKPGLRRLEGRSISVTVRGPDMGVALQVEDGKFQPLPSGQEADAIIAAAPASFIAMALNGGQAAVGQIEISGDADTAQRFQRFFTKLNPDWEEPFSQVFGDVIGFQIARRLRGLLEFTRSASRSLSENVSEYLREESRDLVAPAEMDGFMDDVDDLRDDLARLEARIQALASGSGA